MTGSLTNGTLDLVRLCAQEFPHLRDGVYLNAASFAPIPERTRRLLHDFDNRRARLFDLHDDDLTDALQRARTAAARLIGAEDAEIALGWNASFGINLAAQSLPVRRGGVVVISDREFPANVYPWMGREHLRLETVPADELGRPDEDRILERLDGGDVSVFALSSVQFATGYRADLVRLGRFCRERGIHFVVDAIQSLGQIRLHVREAEIDVLATGGHKWLCSPFGTGFAYVRRELIEQMEPGSVGWTGMEACGTLDSLIDYRWRFRPDARRFEGGTLPFDRLAGLAESLGLFTEIGVEAVESHWHDVLAPLVEWLGNVPEVETLSDLRPERRSAIVSFRPPKAGEVFRSLQAAGIICAFREGAIRIAPHLYNIRSEVERLVDVLDQTRARGWR